jgi:regulator of ribonuclease activity B
MNSDDKYESTLAKQLAMNERTWVALQNHGITQTTLLRLDFLYYCPSESSAQQLAAFLEDETDYEVEMRADRDTKGKWVVEGQTQETSVSREILDQWVEWMVAAGFDHECVFDGWGASV